MALYLQEVLDYSPFKAGLLLLPATGAIIIMTPWGARCTTGGGRGCP